MLIAATFWRQVWISHSGGAAWVATLGWFVSAERDPPPPQDFGTKSVLCAPSGSERRVICKDKHTPSRKATTARAAGADAAALDHRHPCPAAAAGTGAIPTGWHRRPSAGAARRFSGGQADAGSHAAWLPREVTAAHVSASVLRTEIGKLLKWPFSSDGSEMPFLFSWRFCKLRRES